MKCLLCLFHYYKKEHHYFEESGRILKNPCKGKEKSQSEVIEELIEEEAREYEKKKKLEAFERFLKLTKNLSIPENISIQKVKAEIENE